MKVNTEWKCTYNRGSSMKYQDMRNGRFYNEDTFEAMADIPDGAIDMLLVDLPYGTTQCRWDSLLPFDKLWREYNRVCKPNAAMVFTAAQPFSSALVMSNPVAFKVEFIWRKPKGTGHLNAKRMPMRNHEGIYVFYTKQCTYNPQMTTGVAYKSKSGKKEYDGYGKDNRLGKDNSGERYPLTVQEFPSNLRNGIHPTQKPVELFEYLIRTYSNEGDIILDNTAGSGTTAIAAINANRKWVCIEKDEEYYAKSIERLTTCSLNDGEINHAG